MAEEDDIREDAGNGGGRAEAKGSWNYFNYFTEIEEYFWRKRGAHLLVSPLDWAIMETWQKAGVPLEAVLKGIDRAAESHARSRRGGGGRGMKTLAYCADAVLEAAEEMQEASAGARPSSSSKARGASPAFPVGDLRAYLVRTVALTRAVAERHSLSDTGLVSHLREIADAGQATCVLLDAPGHLDLEDLERRLTVLDDKVYAAVTAYASDALQLQVRREMDAQLAMYRRKMKADQLALVERQYLQKRLLEEFGLGRFSLFYFS